MRGAPHTQAVAAAAAAAAAAAPTTGCLASRGSGWAMRGTPFTPPPVAWSRRRSAFRWAVGTWAVRHGIFYFTLRPVHSGADGLDGVAPWHPWRLSGLQPQQSGRAGD
jgi:hypothetical protein